MDWSVVVVVGLIGLALWGMLALSKDDSDRDAMCNLIREHAGDGEVLTKKPSLSPALGFAIRGDQFYYAADKTVVAFPATAVIEATVQSDGATTTKVSRGSQISGAAVGAVLAGPLGAAVGALSGTRNTNAAPPKDVRLRLVIDSDDFPMVDIPFIEPTATGVTNGFNAQREADEWLARVKVMMRRAVA